MKKLIPAALGLVALASIPALAQTATPPAPANQPAPAAGAAAPAASSVKSEAIEISTKSLINESVKNASNETIGDINDVVLSGDGKVAAVIVGVGGFLGMGEKDVALPFDQLMFSKSADDDLVVSTSMTKEGLQSAPEYVKPGSRS